MSKYIMNIVEITRNVILPDINPTFTIRVINYNYGYCIRKTDLNNNKTELTCSIDEYTDGWLDWAIDSLIKEVV